MGRASSIICWNTALQSPMIPTSTSRLWPISAGSISTWMNLTSGGKARGLSKGHHVVEPGAHDPVWHQPRYRPLVRAPKEAHGMVIRHDSTGLGHGVEGYLGELDEFLELRSRLGPVGAGGQRG